MKKNFFKHKKYDKILLFALILTTIIRFLIYIISLSQISSFQQFLDLWTLWDSSWYLSIAQQGYVTTGKDALAIVFYPGYPLIIAIANLIIQNVQLSSLLVSLFFTYLAAIFIYKLTLLDYDKLTAFKAVLFLNIFPTSYFLQAGYTESLFLATSIAAFYFYRTNNLPWSFASGFFATLTRVNGITLIPALFYETKSKKQFITLLLFPLGTIIYLAINYYLYGDFLYFTKILDSNWFKHFSPPWEGIHTLFKAIYPYSEPDFYVYFSEIFTIAVLALLTPLTYFFLRKSYGIYLLTNLLLITSTSFILSTPRYALTFFPIFILFARVKNPIISLLLTLISFLGLLYFSNKFIIGAWAF